MGWWLLVGCVWWILTCQRAKTSSWDEVGMGLGWGLRVNGKVGQPSCGKCGAGYTR
jgi:hypothetical protein